MKTKTLNTNRFIKLSLLSAIAVILMYIDFPVIPIFPWLKIALVYKKNKTKKTAILGMVLGVLCIEVVGILANVYLLLPAYGMAMSKAELMQYVTVGLIPFNGIKSILVCGITYALYKKVSVSIFKVEPMLDKPKQMKENLG